MNLAVAFFIYNRLDTVVRTFETIREAQPNRLYIISDGPKENNQEDAKKVNDVRSYIENRIDWICTVKKNYANANMGCMDRISSGISWVFNYEEAAVILEDDILPTHDFYIFMKEMLEKYKDNEKIMLVSGFKIINDFKIEDSYTFSSFPMIWGWGTWKRSWKYFDQDIKDWPDVKRDKKIRKYFNFWGYVVEVVHLNQIYNHKTRNIWDYQWTYEVLKHDGLAIIPKVNLIQNLGIGHPGATNTSLKTRQNFSVGRLEIPYQHPNGIQTNQDYDKVHMRRGWGFKAIVKKIFRRIINQIPKLKL